MKNELFNMENRKNLTWFYPKLCRFQDNKDFLKQLNTLYNKQGNNRPLLLYIHIPFCASFCSYCACFKENYYSYDYQDREKFTNSIIKEIKYSFNQRYFKDTPVTYILFGGGSPSILETSLLEKIFDAINANCNLSQLKGISFEGNVMSLKDFEKLSMLKEKGVNRVSFGIQTLNLEIRKKLNIKAPIDDIYTCSEMIRKAGIKDFNADIMYNLPDETKENLENDLRIITREIKPTIIQTYRFNLFANTQLEKQLKKKYFALTPSKEKEMEMFQIINNNLSEEGFDNQLFINMYSKLKGRVDTGIELSIGNNKLYGSNMLGIGPGAMTYLSEKCYRNVCSVSDYITKLEKQNTAIDFGHDISKEELEHRVMVMFPNYMHMKLNDIPDEQSIRDKVERLAESGYVRKFEDELVLTDQGKLWAGDISAFFYSETEIQRVKKSYIYSLRHGKNPFNQDVMNINADEPRKRV